MSENMWPNFETAQTSRSPKTVIEEAGRGLAERTKGVVRFYTLSTSIKNDNVEVAFSLYTQALSYHFPFLRAIFAVDPVYPVKVVPDKMPEAVANDENELTTLLGKIFSAPTTIATIQRLLSLSQ
jgi:hypothetical protein